MANTPFIVTLKGSMHSVKLYDKEGKEVFDMNGAAELAEELHGEDWKEVFNGKEGIGRSEWLNDFACPNCGNKACEEGISLVWIEWVTCPVKGKRDNKALVEYGSFEGNSPDDRDNVTASNVPNNKPDLEHFHCEKCQWNWYDPNGHDDSDTHKRK